MINYIDIWNSIKVEIFLHGREYSLRKSVDKEIEFFLFIYEYEEENFFFFSVNRLT